MKKLKVFGIIAALVAASAFVGCGKVKAKHEKVVDHIPNDIRQVVEGDITVKAIRFTMTENGLANTYVISDETLIKELEAVLSTLECDETLVDIACLSGRYITFCGIYEGSNGEKVNGTIFFEGDMLHDGNMRYTISDTEKFEEVLAKIVSTGYETAYGPEINDVMSKLFGYWFGDNLEVGISQDVDGLYKLNLKDDESKKFVILSAVNEAGTFKIVVDNDGKEEEHKISFMSGGKMVFDDIELEMMMME